MELMHIVTAFILAAGIWSVLCRVNLMKHGKTKPKVFLQHAALGMGLACGLFLEPPYAKLLMGSGVLLFLVLGADRWRFGAPSGTTKPDMLAPLDFRKVSGGKKE